MVSSSYWEQATRRFAAPNVSRNAASVAKGASNPKSDVSGSVTVAQVRDIVVTKFKDLNTRDHSQAFRMIAGTARSMGIAIVE